MSNGVVEELKKLGEAGGGEGREAGGGRETGRWADPGEQVGTLGVGGPMWEDGLAQQRVPHSNPQK